MPLILRTLRCLADMQAVPVPVAHMHNLAQALSASGPDLQTALSSCSTLKVLGTAGTWHDTDADTGRNLRWQSASEQQHALPCA